MARLSIIVIVTIVALMCTDAQEYYSNKYDDINLMDILNNEKLRMQYYKCLMDLEPCVTADAKFYRKYIFEAMQTNCKKCTEKQKQLMNELKDWYIKNKPDEWQTLIAKAGINA